MANNILLWLLRGNEADHTLDVSGGAQDHVTPQVTKSNGKWINEILQRSRGSGTNT
jgi:hypothetical protein